MLCGVAPVLFWCESAPCALLVEIEIYVDVLHTVPTTWGNGLTSQRRYWVIIAKYGGLLPTFHASLFSGTNYVQRGTYMKYFLSGLFLLSLGLAQTSFSGVYTTPGRAGDVILTLTQTEDGQVVGTIAGNGVSYNLMGFSDDVGATGTLDTEEFATFTLAAGSSAEEIIFTLSDSKGEQPFTFTRQGDAPMVTDETNPLEPSGDAWLGLFNNAEATRGLMVSAVNNGEYSGNLIIDGFEYPFTATGDETGFTGNYVVGGDALVPFSVTKDGDTVRLEFPDNPESNAELTKAF
jgi:hypothetical protein